MLTPETLAELRRLLDEYRSASGFAPIVDAWYALARGSIARLPDLLDAAAERDRLAGLLDEPRRSGCAVEIAGVRIAPCDERGQTADMRALDTAATERDALAADADKWQRAALTLQGDRDALTDERDSLSWQVEALRAERDARSAERDALAAKVEAVREWIDKRDALDAKLDAVREWIDKRGVNVSDRDDDYMRGYRAAQRHALLEAHDLRHALDADNLDPEPACLIHDVSGEDVRGWEMAECTCPTIRALDGEASHE